MKSAGKEGFLMPSHKVCYSPEVVGGGLVLMKGIEDGAGKV